MQIKTKEMLVSLKRKKGRSNKSCGFISSYFTDISKFLIENMEIKLASFQLVDRFLIENNQLFVIDKITLFSLSIIFQ